MIPARASVIPTKQMQEDSEEEEEGLADGKNSKLLIQMPSFYKSVSQQGILTPVHMSPRTPAKNETYTFADASASKLEL